MFIATVLLKFFHNDMLAYVHMPHHLYIDTAALESNRQTLCKKNSNGAKWRKTNICSNLPAIQTPRWGLAAQVVKLPPLGEDVIKIMGIQ